jgi:ribosomal protein L32
MGEGKGEATPARLGKRGALWPVDRDWLQENIIYLVRVANPCSASFHDDRDRSPASASIFRAMALVPPSALLALRLLPSSLWPVLQSTAPPLTRPSQQWYNPIPAAAAALRGLWEGVLRAVPKQRTTHSRSRHRQMAGKALKDLINIVKCPSCGRPKKSHFLCPYCVHGAFCTNIST